MAETTERRFMMKKMIALFFTTACVFSAVGCGWKMQTKAKEEERKALNYGTAKWNFRQDHNGDWTVDI
ncbi:MAG: hypothetical protein MR884_07775 [Clostridiales bacterium]|nr:hypothetical protein [Clostridiales bacterium]